MHQIYVYVSVYIISNSLVTKQFGICSYKFGIFYHINGNMGEVSEIAWSMHQSDIVCHLPDGMEIRQDFVSGHAFTIMSET